MKPRDEIAKSTKAFFDSTKDIMTRSVMEAARSSNMKLEPKQVEFLIMLLDRTLDDGYHRGIDVFMKSVDTALVRASAPEDPKQSKKK